MAPDCPSFPITKPLKREETPPPMCGVAYRAVV